MIAQILLAVFAFLALGTNTFSILKSSILNKSVLNCSLTRLTRFDIVVITNLIIFKYILNIFGLVEKPRIQDDTLIMREMKVSAALILTDQDIAGFKDAVADDDSMLLPAITTPLVLLLFSKLQCPVFAIGSVNTRNQFRWSAKELHKELRVEATLGGTSSPARRVKRGMELDVTITVYHASDVVFTQIVSILQFMSSRAKPLPPQSSTSLETTSLSSPQTAELKFTTAQPWKWAASCKDYNPIHISWLAAKLFGMPGKLIHGNHAVALAVAKSGYRQSNFEVRFLRPVTIPGTIKLQYNKEVLQLVRNDKVMIEIKNL